MFHLIALAAVAVAATATVGLPVDPLVSQVLDAAVYALPFTKMALLPAELPVKFREGLALIEYAYRYPVRAELAIVGIDRLVPALRANPTLATRADLNRLILRAPIAVQKSLDRLRAAAADFAAEALERAKSMSLGSRVVIRAGVGAINAYVQQICFYGRPAHGVNPKHAIQDALSYLDQSLAPVSDEAVAMFPRGLRGALSGLKRLLKTAARRRWIRVESRRLPMSGFEWFVESDEFRQLLSVVDGTVVDDGGALLELDAAETQRVYSQIGFFALSESGPSGMVGLLVQAGELASEAGLTAEVARLCKLRSALGLARQMSSLVLIRALHMEFYRVVVDVWAQLDLLMRRHESEAWVTPCSDFLVTLVAQTHPWIPNIAWMFEGDGRLGIKAEWLAAKVALAQAATPKNGLLEFANALQALDVFFSV